MQLLSDALAVLGSRHGLIFDPIGRSCRVIRFDTFKQAPSFELRAGLVIEGRECVFPFCGGGAGFDLVDQRTTPCTVSWIGLDARAALKVTLSVIVPFRPRDLDFSSIPVVRLSVSVEPLPGQFRWIKPVPPPEEMELFLEIGQGSIAPAPGLGVDEVDLCFESWLRPDNDPNCLRRSEDRRPQRDALVAPGAARTPRGFRKKVGLRDASSLDVFWCAWTSPTLEIDGSARAFWHARQFEHLGAVVGWARVGGDELRRNATVVDGVVQAHDLGAAVDHLCAYTLHSWLANTWLVDTADGPWLSVWEGSCYFHSTVDVEFTQAPFYLAVWPELLRLQLNQWIARVCAGEKSLGDRGLGTCFMAHDLGRYAEVGAAVYPHLMEVEETANLILLAFVYWRRTGDQSVVAAHAGTLGQLVEYLRATDTDGSGVPTEGVANTIDDGSPAIQFGRRQVYLAVKTLAALQVAAAMLATTTAPARLKDWSDTAARILAAVETDGWRGDHYAVLLERSGRLMNPWTKEWTDYAEIPGWDAPHIYTANTLPVLDMVGFEVGLDRDRVRTDLTVSTSRCLREYGCAHTDFQVDTDPSGSAGNGLTGIASEPGWISMNITRDLAALRRGVDVRALALRYWEWQVLTNTQSHGPQLFFETFGGNHLCFYPRGVAVWGIFEAIEGRVIDQVAGRNEAHPVGPGLRVPILFGRNWLPDRPADAPSPPSPT